MIGNSTYPLPATLTIPTYKQGEKVPVVVLVHGSGPSDRDELFGNIKTFRDIAVGLASKGIAVLRYEKRTMEHPFKFSKEIATVDKETTDDAIYAAKSAVQQEGIDPNNVFILGHSQGGMMMPRILSHAPSSLIRGAIILAAPARTMPELLIDQYRYLGYPQEIITFYEKQFTYLQDPSFNPNNPPSKFVLGFPYVWYDFAHWHPVEVAKKQLEPLFILQGARDYQVTKQEEFSRWQEGLSHRSNVTFKEYPKLNYAFTEGEGSLSLPSEYMIPANVPEYVIEDIAKWINDTKQ